LIGFFRGAYEIMAHITMGNIVHIKKGIWKILTKWYRENVSTKNIKATSLIA